jgi:hypothetical protein
VATPQPTPGPNKQLPAPSQAFAPLHLVAELVSWTPAATKVVHVPAALAHERHSPGHVSTQHVPSTQLPLAHCVPAVHDA